MSVGVATAGRRDGDLRPDGLDERFGRRGPTAVVRDLEEIEPGQSLREQARIDVLLDIPREEEPPRTHGPQQDDRDVVDARSGVRRLGGDLATDRPQHSQRDLIHGQAIASRDHEMGRRTRSSEPVDPGRISGPGSAHARLEHPLDAVASQQQRESRDVVLVRMGQDHGVQAAIPRRDAAIELDQQPIGIRTAVHQEAATARSLDEDGIALPDVEHRDPGLASRAGDDHGARDGHRHDEAGRDDSQDDRPRRLLELDRARRLARDPVPPAPRRQHEDRRSGGHRRSHTDCGFDLDAGERKSRRCFDDPDHQPQRDPSRSGEDGSGRVRQTRRHQDATGHREKPGSHRRCDQGNHEQVHARCDQGEPPERAEDNGERCHLCGDRHPEALGQPAWQAATAQSLEPIRQRRRPGHQAGRGEARKLEAGVMNQRRVGEQQHRRRPAEGRCGTSTSSGFPREQHDAGHRARPHHRR